MLNFSVAITEFDLSIKYLMETVVLLRLKQKEYIFSTPNIYSYVKKLQPLPFFKF